MRITAVDYMDGRPKIVWPAAIMAVSIAGLLSGLSGLATYYALCREFSASTFGTSAFMGALIICFAIRQQFENASDSAKAIANHPSRQDDTQPN